MGMTLANNATSLLALGIDEQETTIQLKAGDGSKFPTLTAGQFFPVTLVTPDREIEIVYVTARTGDTLTVLRGQEGTAQRAFPAGSVVELRLTAGVLSGFARLGKDGDFGRVGVKGWDIDENDNGDLEIGLKGQAPTMTLNSSGGVEVRDSLMIGENEADAFPSGTRLLFQQTTAPTGWTKLTEHDDKALRVVSGNAGAGGSKPFSETFAERIIDRSSLPNITLDVSGYTDNAPDHSHRIAKDRNAGGSGAENINAESYLSSRMTSGNPGSGYLLKSAYEDPDVGWVGYAGGHGHEVSGSTESLNGGTPQTPLDFQVQYLDVIVAEKD